VGASSQARLADCEAWLDERAARELLVVAASADAANDLLRRAAGRGAAGFGWHRATLPRLAAALATPTLIRRGLVPVGRLAAEAVATRAVHALAARGALGRFAPVADGPGLPRAVARTVEELRLAGVEPAQLERVAPDLRRIFDAYLEALREARLADRAEVLALASRAARDASNGHPLLGLPTLLLDVPVESAAERDLLAAVTARAADVLATAPSGDERTIANLRAAGLRKPSGATHAAGEGSSLARLQSFLFEEAAPPERPLDDAVEIHSAPGESRECVELARRLQRLAAEGMPFDRMAILLRSPDEYRPHVEEALVRAGIPAYFARGAVEPDPAGRAFVALLACAEEGLSARRFAEYLSLGEVPDATAAGAPPPAADSGERWVAPDHELVPEVVAAVLAAAGAGSERESGERAESTPPGAVAAGDPEADPVTDGALRAPRRWERLLVDAAVIGGRERWRRRLTGLRRELELDLDELDDPEGPEALRARRALADLAALRDFALPLLDQLASLPRDARWGEWIDALSVLATRSLRHPERVLATLAELAPMADVGPVELAEVALVLSRRLLEIAVPPPRSRYGRVFVAPCEAARGMVFDAVCVPGLAEKLFPKQIGQDPILLDALREELGAGLVTDRDRLARERLALRVAVGAAGRRLFLSYPRLDLEKSRPRVPSFYTLEALRAAEGRLPGFDELAARAERASEARIGWPAPARAEDAIDEAEHDLALLRLIQERPDDESVGAARYLLSANPHLGRALRFRARRWLPRWTGADGLVRPGDDARERMDEAAEQAIAHERPAARSYSPTALQHYAACPYRFFLYAVHRLSPREVPEAIDEMDPLQRGSLVHDVQFELQGRLAERGLLPVTLANLAEARAILEDAVDRVAARHHDELAPAIERVWDDGVAGVRADLREWLRRVAEDASGFVPWRFELAFGLPGRREVDPHSVKEPVGLDCGIRLRGSIDLVERSADGRVRVTDHKTGRDRVKQGSVVAGGASLQPVLYALAAEKLFPDATVEAGRLYYCTAAGGFSDVSVPLDRAARASARTLAETIDAALERPFLPAAPEDRACQWCDYRVVCGPYEQLRAGRKVRGPLAPLQRLRELP
jgi:CRISPR/Cas system-associated exonuclease Cas4 (RecB family)